jgi:uncharacterized damage-inducible protein DinB
MDLSFPIGKFAWPKAITPELRQQGIGELAAAPERFRELVSTLDDSQLDTPYRPGGWTVRQVIHHVPDSHMNAYIRWRLALTEDNPIIKPYDQAKWAVLDDARIGPVEVSLQLLESLHTRWVALIRTMPDTDFERTFQHPEIGTVRLDTILAMYAWHSRHHAAHIGGLRERMGWK